MKRKRITLVLEVTMVLVSNNATGPQENSERIGHDVRYVRSDSSILDVR